jgi:hypothetical protein
MELPGKPLFPPYLRPKKKDEYETRIGLVQAYAYPFAPKANTVGVRSAINKGETRVRIPCLARNR